MSVATLMVTPPTLTSIEPNWYAIYTAVNQEKLVADGLRQRGIEHFLPLYRTVRQRSDRRVILNLPLFPGYLFVKINLSERLRVLELPKVVRIVGTRSLASVVPRYQVEALQLGLESGGGVQPCPYIKEGCRVRVSRGPFAGIEGILLKRKQGLRLVISIELISRSFTVEVGEEDVERIH